MTDPRKVRIKEIGKKKKVNLTSRKHKTNEIKIKPVNYFNVWAIFTCFERRKSDEII